MSYRVTTKTKSVYLITETSWERLEKTEESGELRTIGGTLKEPVVPAVGQILYLWTDIIPGTGADARLIMTTPVAKVEEI